MIIFLYGPDDFRRGEKKKAVIGEFKKKHGALSLDFFDGEQKEEPARLKEFVRAQSIFESKKLAVVENAFEDAKAGEEFAAVLKNVLEDGKTTVLLSERGAPVKKLNFLVAEPVMSQKFEHLTGAEWRKFIASEAKRLGVNVNPDMQELLANVYQNNAWGLVTELQKLANLGKTVITGRDAEILSLETAPSYWAILNALRGRERSSRFEALEYLFSKNEPGAKTFNILASQWREKLPSLANYDLMIKSGKLDYEEALVDLAL